MPRISLAPMLDRTGPAFRAFLRTLTKQTTLFTELIPAQALLHQPLRYKPEAFEHPIAIQLGGEDPSLLANAAALAQELGFDEVNLNCGCPSERVQLGSFGAALMKKPETVRDSVFAMKKVVSVPVTVKHRIGITPNDQFKDLLAFVDTVAEAQCDSFIVHARGVFLDGRSPADNRKQELRPNEVFHLKEVRPELKIEFNGDIKTLSQAESYIQKLDGAMIGRAALQNPYLFSQVDQRFYGSTEPVTPRLKAVQHYFQYVRAHLEVPSLQPLLQPLANLYLGCAGAAGWRRSIGEAHCFKAEQVLSDLEEQALRLEL